MSRIEWKKDGDDYTARGRLGEGEWSSGEQPFWDALVESSSTGPWLVSVRFFADAESREREDWMDEVTVRSPLDLAEAGHHVETILHTWQQTVDKLDRALGAR